MDVFKASKEKYEKQKQLKEERRLRQIVRIEAAAKAVKDVMKSIQDIEGVTINRRGFGMFRQQFLMEVHSFHIKENPKYYYEICVKPGSLDDPEEPVYISVIYQGEGVHKTFRIDDPDKMTEKVEACIAHIADNLFDLLYK